MATILSSLVEVRPRAGQGSFAALLERVEGERDEFDQAVLSSGVLLTWEGEGHTAYGRSNECVTEVVDAFLLSGAVPEDGTRC